MSFDLVLQKFENGEEVATISQPILDVLNEVRHEPSHDGWYNIHAEDGTGFEFNAEGLENAHKIKGAQFRLFSLTRPVTEFVYAIANAGEMVIFNAQAAPPDEPMMILPANTKPSGISHLTDDIGHPALIQSGEELFSLLAGGIEQWEQFRQQIADG